MTLSAQTTYLGRRWMSAILYPPNAPPVPNPDRIPRTRQRPMASLDQRPPTFPYETRSFNFREPALPSLRPPRATVQHSCPGHSRRSWGTRPVSAWISFIQAWKLPRALLRPSAFQGITGKIPPLTNASPWLRYAVEPFNSFPSVM